MSRALLDQILAAAGEPPSDDNVQIAGADPVFPLELPVGTAGAATIAASALAAARLWQLRSGRQQQIEVDVDAAAAAMRGDHYMKWDRPPEAASATPVQMRASNADIYRSKDGRWVYLHRGFAHHRQRIAGLLGGANDPEALAAAISGWNALELEDAVHAAGACAGMVRTFDEWRQHEQANAVAGLPLLEIIRIGDSEPEPFPAGARPLAGIRVLDLTRVLAGPTSARTLAEHGAEVLRIGTDLIPNNEAQLIDTGHGKRSTVLNLTSDTGRDQLRALISRADVFSQGYRPDSLAGKGFGPEEVAAMRPGIIYVSLSAFSHAGPWSHRRGFDTLVQAVSGISNDYAIDGRPRLLPVSAIDYTTGYLSAFGAMVALGRRAREGGSYLVRLSLAQAGRWLTRLDRIPADKARAAMPELPPKRIAELSTVSETPFGPVTHLAPIARLSDTPGRWERPAVPLDHDEPVWLS